MNGYIKLFRQFQKWEWYDDANTMRVFLHILLNVNIKPSRYRGCEIPVGAGVFGRKRLAEDLQLSEQNIRTALEHLKSTNEITIKSTNRFSIITVENWEKFQIDEGIIDQQTNQQNNQQVTNKQPTSNQQVTTEEEYKKNKKNKNNNIFCKPTIEEIQIYISDNGYSVNAEKFYDYYESNGWKVGRNSMKDWKAAIRTWQRNSKPNNIGNEDSEFAKFLERSAK